MGEETSESDRLTTLLGQIFYLEATSEAVPILGNQRRCRYSCAAWDSPALGTSIMSERMEAARQALVAWSTVAR